MGSPRSLSLAQVSQSVERMAELGSAGSMSWGGSGGLGVVCGVHIPGGGDLGAWRMMQDLRSSESRSLPEVSQGHGEKYGVFSLQSLGP